MRHMAADALLGQTDPQGDRGESSRSKRNRDDAHLASEGKQPLRAQLVAGDQSYAPDGKPVRVAGPEDFIAAVQKDSDKGWGCG